MNNVYKIIFDTATQTFKVVSELARSGGKKQNLSNQIKSNQIKSNQIKSNQIKSNQM